jgi:anti-sigma regulatory factor (Ser/Thr protein kinase)
VEDLDLAAHARSGHPGGLGLQLVRRLVDNLQYQYQNRCNLITFSKGLES